MTRYLARLFVVVLVVAVFPDAARAQAPGRFTTLTETALADLTGLSMTATSTNRPVVTFRNVTTGNLGQLFFANDGSYEVRRNVGGNLALLQLSATGALTSGTYNGQTISSAASFTGSITSVGALSVNTGGSATSGFVNGMKIGSWDAVGFESTGGVRVAVGGYRSSQFTEVGLYTGGTERVRIGSAGNMGIAATAKIFLDGTGLTGDTYLQESSANTVDLFTGGTSAMTFTATAITSPARLETSAAIRTTGLTNLPAAGAGVEIIYNSGSAIGVVQAFDRSGAVYKAMSIDGSTVTINQSGTTRVTVNAGVQIGAPTGGDKGAGTINVATDVYKNNTLYANPDYVFEHFYTGKIEKYAANEGAKDYTGLMPLPELESYVRVHNRFPVIPDAPTGAFARADISLILHEQAALYLFNHEARIAALEAKLEGK